MSLKDGEEMRPVLGYANLYYVTNFGRVLSAPRKGSRNWRVLKPGLVGGYESVNLSVFGVRKSFAIHRLVAEAFLEPPTEPDMVVNHIDLNKLNNRSDNLEWVTKSENTKHAHREGAFIKSTMSKLRGKYYEV